MKIYKYWAKHIAKIDYSYFNGQTGRQEVLKNHPFTFFGGSNLSERDAEQAAKDKAQKIRAIIAGELKKQYDYTVDIKEEVISTIDENNVITRNRYGALILNCAHTMFVDIDKSDFNFFYITHTNIFTQIINALNKKSLDQKILDRIEKTSHKRFLRNNYIRVYETPAGYRLLITGEPFDPRSKRSKKILTAFGSDWLYNTLCEKQNCYRARLTPKPNRIHVKGHRVVFPFRDEEQEAIHQAWIRHYHEKAEGYAACRYLTSYGSKPFSTSKVIEYHDKVSNALEDFKIA